MRLFALFLLTLFVCIWFACFFDPPVGHVDVGPLDSYPWRRTVDGWERADTFLPQVEEPESVVVDIHPAIVAGLQLLVSVGALMLFSHHTSRRVDRRADAVPAQHIGVAVAHGKVPSRLGCLFLSQPSK